MGNLLDIRTGRALRVLYLFIYIEEVRAQKDGDPAPGQGTLESSCSAHEKWPLLEDKSSTAAAWQVRGSPSTPWRCWSGPGLTGRQVKELFTFSLAALFSKESHLPSEHEMFTMGISDRCLPS